MANVTGGYTPGEEEGNFSRRGSGAGKFRPPGPSSSDGGAWWQSILNQLNPNLGSSPQITGDVGETGPVITQGGMGRNRGGAAVTVGGSGANRPQGRLPLNLQGGAGFAGYGATALGLIPGAMGTLQSQGLGAAATSTAAGLGAAAIAAPISKALMMAPHPLAKVAGFGLQALAPAMAQQGVAGLMGKAEETSQRPGAGPDISIGNVPLTETAALRQQREFDRAQTLQDIKQYGGAEIALTKEISDYMLTKEIEGRKAMAPIIERAQRAQLTNAQAMLASQTAAYQQLGRSAMVGKLAGIQAQERGATMRQALASNPYVGSIMQAPQISFG